MSKIIVWVDCDGVLCDMEKRYQEIFKMTPSEARDNLSSADLRKYWKFFVETSQFATLDKHPSCDELVSYLKGLPKRVTVATLTSSSGFEHHDIVQGHKIHWLKENNIPFIPVVVPGRKYKKGYATSNSFLIDDHHENVSEFIAAGGNGVIHTNAHDTIKAVEEFLKCQKS